MIKEDVVNKYNVMISTEISKMSNDYAYIRYFLESIEGFDKNVSRPPSRYALAYVDMGSAEKAIKILSQFISDFSGESSIKIGRSDLANPIPKKTQIYILYELKEIDIKVVVVILSAETSEFKRIRCGEMGGEVRSIKAPNRELDFIKNTYLDWEKEDD